ncbi:MAG: glycosyl hydrolase family 8 [Gammaproteobacteria bacterium]
MRFSHSLSAIGFLFISSISSTYAANITFVNNTPAVVHLDYTNCTWVSGSQPDGSGNFPSHASALYSCAPYQNLDFAQYGVDTIITPAPKSYISVNAGGVAGLSTDSIDVTLKSNTATIAWPVPKLNYTDMASNIGTIVQQYIALKPSPATSLLPNVIAMDTQTLTAQKNSPDWQLQASYDASRFPLWNGAYCLANVGVQLCPHDFLTSYMQSVKTSSPSGSINTAGYWAFTAGSYQDGQAVAGGSADVKPALVGPLAVAEAAVDNGQTTSDGYYNTLINQLASYDLNVHTPNSAQGQGYPNSSDPYFNGALNLLTEALLTGNGNFNLNASDSRTGYVSYNQFMANYTAWTKDGFIVPFTVSDENGKEYPGIRVVFSVDVAPHTGGDNWKDAGASPTVSEGMAYGLLVSYAANDQASFDKMLNYILFEARTVGCAGMDSTQTSCSVKTNYLMPWMVDQTGKPFHYVNAGGFLTNGSATDADLNIAWALSLANDKWKTPSNNLMGNENYAQLITDLKNEMAFFDFNQQVNFMGNGNYTTFSPGSQWGNAGRSVLYPGYDAPAALKAMAS